MIRKIISLWPGARVPVTPGCTCAPGGRTIIVPEMSLLPSMADKVFLCEHRECGGVIEFTGKEIQEHRRNG